MNKKDNTTGRHPVMQSISLALNFGMTVSVTIVIGIIVGAYLDQKLGGTGIVLALLVILSAIIALYAGIRRIQNLTGKPKLDGENKFTSKGTK